MHEESKRFALSNKIIVLDIFAKLFNFFIFVSLFFGKKPPKKNSLVGKPDTVSDAITDEAPGILVTSRFLFMQFLTSLYPGSDISGVPASLVNAITFPSSIFFIMEGLVLSALNS